MRHSFRVMLGLGLALGAAGCSDYLSGPGVSQDPNNIVTLSKPGPLYVAIQAAQPVQFEGQIARIAALYMQQVAGTSRQQQGFDLYTISPSSNGTDLYFGAVYGASAVSTGGGALLDIHKLQQLGRKANDSLYIGVGKIFEALVIGFAADNWGDIPYRQAADSTILQPKFDPQLQIYGDLQAQLDSAINIFLTATGPSNTGGSDGSELIYHGKNAAQLRALYTQVAHSLKARLYMHVAATDPTAYQKALAEAQLGISTPANDFLWFHDATPTGNNIWWQFEVTRSSDLGPGAAVIEILKRRINAGVEDSARIKFYFTKTKDGGYFGYRPGRAKNVQTTGGIYNGNGSADSTYSGFNAFIDGATPPGDFRQPELTYAETQLIAAEASFQIGGTAAAQPFLDAARKNRAYGLTGGAAVTFPDLPSVPATLQNIMEEKYVTLYLNPEVWSDWKRTCLPSLATAPSSGGTTPQNFPIPGRVPYGQTEINANPNTPTTSSAGVAITSTSINPNQPTACPALNYTSSSPLGN
ncbi:MAG TPA: SusD/RagB family nutrient-binding outer membrane lipoprotein [Gemmatimonadales bacterium]|nr:SusD/RagB family nutrient-binding outer membrane lipoprotein [Gemmatimonadales bacterium]